MALNPHVQTDFSAAVMSYLESRFLDMIKAELHLAQFGMPKSLAKRQGNTIKFFRWDTPAGTAQELTDGTTPNGTKFTQSTVDATLKQYGKYSTVSDRLSTVAINDTHKDLVDVLGYDAALVIDGLVRDEARSGGTIHYADDAANSSIANVEAGTDRLTSLELRQVVSGFRTSNSRPFEDGYFKLIVNPLQEVDLFAETAANSFLILAANNTTANDMIDKLMVGKAGSLKIFRSTNITADSTSTNTYGAIALAKNGMGTIGIETLKPEMIIKPLGFGEDPLNQRSSVGYKFWYVAKTLRQADVRVIWSYSA